MDYLTRLGFRSSEVGLRQDVYRRLISPSMPGYELIGRGRRALWTPTAVKRAEYQARLRKLKVDGRTLPLLSYIYDGWGWRHIADFVGRSIHRIASHEHRSIRPDRFRTDSDIEDVAAQPDNIESSAYAGATLEARKYVLSVIAGGVPAVGYTAAPMSPELISLVERAVGARADHVAVAKQVSLAERVPEARRQWGMTPLKLGDWLQSLDDETAERGRQSLLANGMAFRQFMSAGAGSPSAGPLTMFGSSRTELRQRLRTAPGRPTGAQLLSAWLGQEIYAAELLRRVAIE